MSRIARRKSAVFMMLMIVQIVSPTLAVPLSSTMPLEVTTNADTESLAQLDIVPTEHLAYGWSAESLNAGTASLKFRTMNLVPPLMWEEVTGQSDLDGYHVISHAYPVPTEWFGQLEQAGIGCLSYLPPAGFHCDLNGATIEQLLDLDVQGIGIVDGVDKIETNLIRGLLGIEMTHENPFVGLDNALVSIALSGNELPAGIGGREDVSVYSHSNRFATLGITNSGLAWLASQDTVEWIEAKPVFNLANDEAIGVMNVDDVWDNSIMSAIDASWSGLDGSGIIVTVADTGLDNGVNNSNMHPDFKDHIKGILSFPPSAATCFWYSISPCVGDDAKDLHGHGTHVAGSVLGDGTDSSGSIVGAAPEAQLLFHAIATTYGGSEELIGLPDDLEDMFALAWANGSRIHTNSWGSPEAGAYTTSAMQADTAAYNMDELLILFAAANEGEDANGDGEIDLDSLGSPASGKNVLTVGASENDRPTFNSVWGSGYGSPISSDKVADNPEGMAAFSSRGPADDDRIKPDISAPGTFILSTKSRSAGTCSWGSYSTNSNYCYMGGTSMATPLTAGASALLIEHLIENEGESNPTSSLIKAIFTASAHDMEGQYSSSTNGAGETAPNNHEGWGLVNMSAAVNTSWVQGHSVTTNDERAWSFTVPANADDFTIALAWTDYPATALANPTLVNDLDLAVKNPSGTWTNLSNDRDNLRGLKFASPAQGTWEVHVVGTSVSQGPQFFSVAINGDFTLVNTTSDTDSDGFIDDEDDCNSTFGTSDQDRNGCPDTDGDGYSNPDGSWTVNDGADAFASDATQWEDTDFDGFGDNSAGYQPDGCVATSGSSTLDRYGCPDSDSDGYSDGDGTWTTSEGADSCEATSGTSSQDRNGCTDSDADGYSDPDGSWTTANGADAFVNDATQWADSDGDSYGDNPPPATDGDGCPSTSGSSTLDRFGCTDTDGDGYSDPDGTWTTGDGADAFVNDNSQWADADGDGYGDNSAGTDPDSCPSVAGTSTENGILGCLDTDGDGFADTDDAFPTEGTQWEDSDADGYGDEATGFQPDACVSTPGSSTIDRYGCPDSDGDGASDPDGSWTAANGADAMPSDSTQWADTDGDGYGDNPTGTNGDGCPLTAGNSTQDRLGCTDTDGDGYSDPDVLWTENDGADAYPNDPLRWGDADGDGYDDGLDDDCPALTGTSNMDRNGCPDQDGDGYSDPTTGYSAADGADAFPTDGTQWNDTDSDGFGDNPVGNQPDACPSEGGDSWQNNTLGCPDADGDGWADIGDAFPTIQSQWLDSDGDGYGDNLGGVNPDACPSEAGNSTLGNRLGCVDDDGDGWDNSLDALPDSPTQWLDQDGDGYGDNAFGDDADDCPGVAGTSTVDRLGCLDTDGDGYSDEGDDFPNDPTKSTDSDNDGFDDLTDACPTVTGTSVIDRLGCIDSDGDGVSNPTTETSESGAWNLSDGADAFPFDSSQTTDSDGDGFGDNPAGNFSDSCPATAGTSTADVYGCEDDDGDMFSNSGDEFPTDNTQWVDIDADGYGDNINGTNGDACPTLAGTSTVDQFGCVDTDDDGVSDEHDLWVNDDSQWYDSDQDGYGDEPLGTDGDTCPADFGTSTALSHFGCPDADKDGYWDEDDAFPEQRSQYFDSDGDGWGDNGSFGAYKPDHWPNDPTKNSATGTMTCTPTNVAIDLAAAKSFTFTCTVSSTIDTEFTGVVQLEFTQSVYTDVSTQYLSFTEEAGTTQTVTFTGHVRETGVHQLLLLVREPGAEHPMDTVTITVKAQDSNAPEVKVQKESSGLSNLADHPATQAAAGGGALAILMGTLVLRGRSKNKQSENRRRERAQELMEQRGVDLSTPLHRSPVQRQVDVTTRTENRRGPTMFDDYKRKR